MSGVRSPRGSDTRTPPRIPARSAGGLRPQDLLTGEASDEEKSAEEEARELGSSSCAVIGWISEPQWCRQEAPTG